MFACRIALLLILSSLTFNNVLAQDNDRFISPYGLLAKLEELGAKRAVVTFCDRSVEKSCENALAYVDRITHQCSNVQRRLIDVNVYRTFEQHSDPSNPVLLLAKTEENSDKLRWVELAAYPSEQTVPLVLCLEEAKVYRDPMEQIQRLLNRHN